MGRGRVELPTHGFSVRASNCTNDCAFKGLRLHGEDLAHHLPTGPKKTDAPDPNLAELLEAWSDLPPAAREAVMAVFRAVKPR